MSDPHSEYTVSPQESGSRLDRFLSQRAGISRAEATRLIEAGQVRVGRGRGRKGIMLAEGNVVILEGTAQDPLQTPPPQQPELPLRELYADDQVVVFNKTAGQPSHPLRGGERDTAASALVARYPECATASDPPREGGLCHRLDTHTSGALLAARDHDAWLRLRRAFQEGYVDKEYLALCVGAPPRDQGQVALPLLPWPGHPEKMKVAESLDDQYRADALDAETSFTVERSGNGYSLLRVQARSGRRHQIRAHLAYLGLPLVGDELYGGPAIAGLLPAGYPGGREELGGQILHAAVLRFPHPGREEQITVVAPLPPSRQALVDWLLSARS